MSEIYRGPIEEIREPSVPPPVLEPSPLPLEPAEFAFSNKQRKALRERDGERCQAKGIIPHECNSQLHVHHIIPQRYAHEQKPPIDPDFEENGLTICENAHKKIHPDMEKAAVQYHRDPSSFHQMFQERQEKIKHRKIYWNDQWDRQLHTKAVQNTQLRKALGWIFPNGKKH